MAGLHLNRAVVTAILWGLCLHAHGETPQVLPQFEDAVPSLSRSMAVKRQLYLKLFEQEGRAQAVPPELVDAVAFVESGYNSTEIGRSGEVGIMQVLPSTAALLGFQGSRDQLADPETNIHYGVKYLAGALRIAGGDICRALMKYRAGYAEEALSALSLAYCRKARQHLVALGSSLATAAAIPVTAALVAAPNVGSIIQNRALSPAERSRQFWAAEEARIKAIVATVHAKWARLAQHNH